MYWDHNHVHLVGVMVHHPQRLQFRNVCHAAEHQARSQLSIPSLLAGACWCCTALQGKYQLCQTEMALAGIGPGRTCVDGQGVVSWCGVAVQLLFQAAGHAFFSIGKPSCPPDQPWKCCSHADTRTCVRQLHAFVADLSSFYLEKWFASVG